MITPSYAILITVSPLEKASEDAFQFIQTVLNQGQKIKCIFFYQDGVYHGNRLIYLENAELIERWQKLSDNHNLDLILCSASAARRGVMDAAHAAYFGKDCENLAKGFRIAGLTVWYEALCSSDELQVFGDLN